MRFSILSALAVLSTAVFAHPAAEAHQIQARTNGWAIKNFTRSSTNGNAPVAYTFIIDTYGTLNNCTIIDNTNPAWYNPWYDLPCQNAPFRISWGWEYPGDFTVMTVRSVVQAGNSQQCYFGYDHPNAGLPGTVYYPDKGYNTPQ